MNIPSQKPSIIFSNYDDRKNPYYGGGGAVAVHEVAKRLVDASSITVVTGKYPGSKDEMIDGVFYKRIGTSKIKPPLALMVYQLLLPFYAMKMKYEVWVESFTAPYSTAFLPIFTRKPVIGLTHLLAGRPMYRKYKIPFHWIEKIGLKFYKYVIALNDELKNQILSANKKAQVAIIPNGVPESLISAEFEKQGNHILYLGRIDYKQKGLDMLLEVYKKIANNTNLNLIIAGGGEQKEIDKLMENIKNLELATRVHYVGKAEGETKEKLFKEAKVFVMTSRFEAFPLTLIEAWCYKCPVVLFNIDVLRWIPESFTKKIEPFSVEKFSQELLNLSNSQEEWKIMGEKAKEFSQKFSWNNASRMYEEFIRNVK